MRTFETAILIDGTRSRVWSVMADLSRWPEWTESIDEIEVVDDSELGPGSRIRIKQPKLPPSLMTITEWVEGQSFVWESRQPGVRAVAFHTMVEREGGCEVQVGVRFSGFLSGLIGLVYGKLTQQYVEMEAAGLKAESEKAD